MAHLLIYLFHFDPQNDKDDIDNIIEEVNAISGERQLQVSIEKTTSKFLEFS